MEQGVYTSIDNAQYHSGPGFSKSQLDMVRKSPGLLLWSKQAANDNSSGAAHIGTALHMLLLEPEKFDTAYIAAPGKFDLRTTAGKAARAEFEAEAAGRTVLDADEWAMLQAQRDSVMAHPEARALLEVKTGIAEASAYWLDQETGLLCRCRPDWWPYPEVIVDVKTTDDPGVWSFGKSISDYRYHVQDAFYSDGASIASGTRVDAFFFLAIGKKREMGRYPVRFYELHHDDRAAGRTEYSQDLHTIKQCMDTGEWPGIETIRLPAYTRS